MAKLPDDVSAKLALNKFKNNRAKKLEKRQKRTQFKPIEKNVNLRYIDLEQAIEQTQNRKQWRGQIECITNLI